MISSDESLSQMSDEEIERREGPIGKPIVCLKTLQPKEIRRYQRGRQKSSEDRQDHDKHRTQYTTLKT